MLVAQLRPTLWDPIPYFLDTYRIKEANKMFRKLIMTLEITRKAETGIISWTFKFSYFCNIFQFTLMFYNEFCNTDNVEKSWNGYACQLNTIFLRWELIVCYLSCKVLAVICIFKLTLLDHVYTLGVCVPQSPSKVKNNIFSFPIQVFNIEPHFPSLLPRGHVCHSPLHFCFMARMVQL